MSKNGSEREFIFSLYLKENLSILEKELNLKLTGVELESKYAGLKIDMFAIELESGAEVFVENVLLKSDYSHQYRLLKLIEAIDKGVIIYQAVAFKEKYVKQLRDKVMDSGKDINLYFVTINPDLFQGIDLLNSGTHKLKVFENLHILNEISNPIQLLKDISIIHPIHGNKEYREKYNWDFTKREDVNNYLLKQLRKKVPYFLSFQRQKSNLDSLRIIPCGFGKSGISLMLTVEDIRHRAFVELRFKEDTPPIYFKIKEKKVKARKIIGEELEFLDDTCTIAYRFRSYEDVYETVERLVQIAERFILTFSNDVLYGEEKLDSWKEELEYSL